MVQPNRRLVPIVSLDIVGYSRLVERNERQTLRLVQRVYDRLIASTIGPAGGKVFKTMGDGLLAEFNSVVAAVQWTADLQREIYQRRRDVIVDGLQSAGWDVAPTRGGMFQWVKIPEPWAGMGSMEFSMRLLEEAKVVVSPGLGFGPEGEDHLRFALVENEKRLRQGMRNIREHFPLRGPLAKAQ